MKTFIVPAILLPALMAGTSYGGGLFSEDEGTSQPSNRYPVAWANAQVAHPAEQAGYPGYAYTGFAVPMYMSSWGKSPCGPDCGSVWAGYKTCHQGGYKQGWGGGCGFGGCGKGGFGHAGCGQRGCGKGRCRGCGFGTSGCGDCGTACDSCVPRAVGCSPSCGPKFKFNSSCKPKCKAKKCRPNCDKCCGQGFGGRPRCGACACSGCGWSNGCAGDIGNGDFSGHAGEYYESMPADAGQPLDGQSGAEPMESAPSAEDVPPPLEARLWRGLSTLLPIHFSQN